VAIVVLIFGIDGYPILQRDSASLYQVTFDVFTQQKN